MMTVSLSRVWGSIHFLLTRWDSSQSRYPEVAGRLNSESPSVVLMEIEYHPLANWAVSLSQPGSGPSVIHVQLLFRRCMVVWRSARILSSQGSTSVCFFGC